MARFQPGQSGNPKGRKPGESSRATKIRQALESESDELVKTAVALAKSGDVQALRLCLERLCAPLKPIALPAALPLDSNAALPVQGQQLLDAMAKGKLSIPDTALLLAALANQSKLEESTELRERVAALESLSNVRPEQ